MSLAPLGRGVNPTVSQARADVQQAQRGTATATATAGPAAAATAKAAPPKAAVGALVAPRSGKLPSLAAAAKSNGALKVATAFGMVKPVAPATSAVGAGAAAAFRRPGAASASAAAGAAKPGSKLAAPAPKSNTLTTKALQKLIGDIANTPVVGWWYSFADHQHSLQYQKLSDADSEDICDWCQESMGDDDGSGKQLYRLVCAKCDYTIHPLCWSGNGGKKSKDQAAAAKEAATLTPAQRRALAKKKKAEKYKEEEEDEEEEEEEGEDGEEEEEEEEEEEDEVEKHERDDLANEAWKETEIDLEEAQHAAGSDLESAPPSARGPEDQKLWEQEAALKRKHAAEDVGRKDLWPFKAGSFVSCLPGFNPEFTPLRKGDPTERTEEDWENAVVIAYDQVNRRYALLDDDKSWVDSYVSREHVRPMKGRMPVRVSPYAPEDLQAAVIRENHRLQVKRWNAMPASAKFKPGDKVIALHQANPAWWACPAMQTRWYRATVEYVDEKNGEYRLIYENQSLANDWHVLPHHVRKSTWQSVDRAVTQSIDLARAIDMEAYEAGEASAVAAFKAACDSMAKAMAANPNLDATTLQVLALGDDYEVETEPRPAEELNPRLFGRTLRTPQHHHELVQRSVAQLAHKNEGTDEEDQTWCSLCSTLVIGPAYQCVRCKEGGGCSEATGCCSFTIHPACFIGSFQMPHLQLVSNALKRSAIVTLEGARPPPVPNPYQHTLGEYYRSSVHGHEMQYVTTPNYYVSTHQRHALCRG